MTKKTTPPAAAQPPAREAVALPVDDFHGKGGSYVMNKTTGKREQAPVKSKE